MVNLKFKIIDDKIIAEIPVHNHKPINIFFDSGSNEFLLDSNIVTTTQILTVSEQKWNVSFFNGVVAAKFFTNTSLFQDSILNNLYNHGSLLVMKKLNIKCSVPIDGIIGINNKFKHYWVKIDFSKGLITIADQKPQIKIENTTNLQMVYTDEGGQSSHSNMTHQMPACKMNIIVNTKMKFDTNVLFDTGFDGRFGLFTQENLDSLSALIAAPVIRKIRTEQRLAGALPTIYKLPADSLILDHAIIEKKDTLYAMMASKNAMTGFGNFKVSCYAGIKYLKTYSSICFDFFDNTISLVK